MTINGARFLGLEDEIGTVDIHYGMANGSIALWVELSAFGAEGIENRTFEISIIDDIAVATDVEGDVAIASDPERGNVATFDGILVFTCNNFLFSYLFLGLCSIFTAFFYSLLA